MAIYHLSAKIISRGKGKSSTAAAAYRAGDKIHDSRLGKTFDYTRKQGVYATEILAPHNAPDWVRNREQLWNAVELFETRKNSQLAREFDIALPVELSHDQKRSLVKNWVSDKFVNSGVAADVAFHDLNSQNPHVHIMLTTRVIDSNGFGRKTREWDKKDFLLLLRESWANYTNSALEKAGNTERIDHRTLEEQGINRIPQIHLGADVATMMDKGIVTERGEAYLTIEAANREIEALERQLTHIDETIKPIGEDELEFSELELPNKSISTSQSDEQSERERENTTEPDSTEFTEQLQRITESLTSSSQRAIELGESLRTTNKEPEREYTDITANNQQRRPISRNTDTTSESNTTALRRQETSRQPSPEAERLTREFQVLEERARNFSKKNRNPRKSAFERLGELTAQFKEGFGQFVKSILPDPEDVEQRQVQSDEYLESRRDSYQAPGVHKEHLGDSSIRKSDDLGVKSNISPQRQPITGHKGQSEQYRDSSQPHRETKPKVKPVPPAQPQAQPKLNTTPKPQPQPQPKPQPAPQPPNSEQVLAIARTAVEAVKKYGRELDKEKTFNNSSYQVQQRAVFETYGWRHYLTITAKDGRGKLLTMKGQGGNPDHMDVIENRLSSKDVKQFSDLQTALDYCQQVRQFRQDAEKILSEYGTRTRTGFNYGTLEGKKYRIVFDEEAFKVFASDGRGEVLNYPSDFYSYRSELKAKANFNNDDANLFRELATQIEQDRRQRQQQWLNEQKRQRSRGLER